MNHKSAFSLIELLVVVALLGGLSVATSRIFFSQLKGTEKTQSLIELRQAGDQALLAIKNKIRNARRITPAVLDCAALPSGASGGSIEIQSRNPVATGFGAESSVATMFVCGSRIVMNEAGVNKNLTPSSLTLSACSFSCSKVDGQPAVVTIDFTLLDPLTSDSLDFSSTVTVRNYK